MTTHCISLTPPSACKKQSGTNVSDYLYTVQLEKPGKSQVSVKTIFNRAWQILNPRAVKYAVTLNCEALTTKQVF